MEEIKIDLASPENQTALNPRLPKEVQTKLHDLSNRFPEITGHIWLTTSGSTANPKLVALSKGAISASAAAVNRHIGATKTDRWLMPLPEFHVGGLSILARAEGTGSAVYPLGFWNAKLFRDMCRKNQITLTSLVPTQLFDLLSLDLEAPPSLRAVLIGGGRLSDRLYQRARALKWPVLPSFGSTEAASQIATASLGSLRADTYPDLLLLSHFEASVSEDGRLALRGPSLFTGYAHFAGDEPVFTDPKKSGTFVSEDLVSLHETPEGTAIVPKGRANDTIKISGELVSVSQLNEQLEEILESASLKQQAVVIAIADARLENRIALVGSCSGEELLSLKETFAGRVLPVARPREVYQLQKLPVSPLGKPLVNEIYTALKSGEAHRIYPTE